MIRRVMNRLALDIEGIVLCSASEAGALSRDEEFALGRTLASTAVAHLVGIDTADAAISVTELGAPYAVGYSEVCLSISHTRGLVLAGAVIGDYFGIDVEWAQRDVTRLTRSLLPDEMDFVEGGRVSVLELLVAKEAVAKSWGTGLGGGLRRWPAQGVGEGWVEIGGDGGARRARVHRVEFADGGAHREALIATVSG